MKSKENNLIEKVCIVYDSIIENEAEYGNIVPYIEVERISIERAKKLKIKMSKRYFLEAYEIWSNLCPQRRLCY